MPKDNSSIRDLTDEEEALAQAGIVVDSDNPEWTDEDFSKARPASEVLPPSLYAALTRPRGRPKADETKVPVTIRLDRSALAAFRLTGRGWQTRMSDMITEAAKKLDSA